MEMEEWKNETLRLVLSRDKNANMLGIGGTTATVLLRLIAEGLGDSWSLDLVPSKLIMKMITVLQEEVDFFAEMSRAKLV